ncbi:MAG: hypothetical protein BWY79_00582 [Actinobacteria bacterium ADurb.Bin444]|nr:MAG: hypothetical protein BWY79_00582 [Actinobacteria bacterium ADurb.Bin444]
MTERIANTWFAVFAALLTVLLGPPLFIFVVEVVRELWKELGADVRKLASAATVKEKVLAAQRAALTILILPFLVATIVVAVAVVNDLAGGVQ